MSSELPNRIPRIFLYTDGAARGNPGPGGYGIVLKSGGHYKELSGGFKYTTNNRMELMAAIVGLESIKIIPSDVLIYTDSKYVCEAVEKKWLFTWIKTGFKNKKNPDLWMRFYKIFKQHNVRLKWLKGHAGHIENERCDVLATTAAQKETLRRDEFFESSQNDNGIFNEKY